MRVAALVLAAGSGERLGAGEPKAFVSLAGRSLVARSIETLLRCDAIDAVLPVVPASHIDDPELCAAGDASGVLLPAVPGGVRRQDSVAAGLNALPEEVGWVAIHDAARCLVEASAVTAVVERARACGAAILAHPSPDTVKLVEGVRIRSTPERATCWAAETPQVFRADLLREGLEKADAEGFTATDDAQLVERLGVDVEVVEGSVRNLKITRPADLAIAEALLREEEGA